MNQKDARAGVYTRRTYMKVIVGFSVCPLYVTALFGIVFSILITIYRDLDSLFVLLEMSAFGFVFLPASFLLGLVYAVMRMKRNFWGLAAVIVMGSFGAIAWTFFYLSEDILSTFGLSDPPYGWVFLFGAITSFISGLLFLPKPAETQQPKESDH